MQRSFSSLSSSLHRLTLIHLLITSSFSLWLRPLFTFVQSALQNKTDVRSWETAEWKSELCSAMYWYYIAIIKWDNLSSQNQNRTEQIKRESCEIYHLCVHVLWNNWNSFWLTWTLSQVGATTRRQRDPLFLLFSLSFKYRKQLSTICLNALRDKKQKFQLDAREHNKVWRVTSPLRQWRLPKSTWTQRNTRL